MRDRARRCATSCSLSHVEVGKTARNLQPYYSIGAEHMTRHFAVERGPVEVVHSARIRRGIGMNDDVDRVKMRMVALLD